MMRPARCYCGYPLRAENAMNSYERVCRALERGEPDRVPLYETLIARIIRSAGVNLEIHVVCERA